jgi:TonB family protein
MRIHRLYKTAALCTIGSFFFLGLLVWNAVAVDQPDQLDSIYVDEVNMIRGELVSLKVYSLTRVNIADSQIADISEADDQKILLRGNSVGQTALFIWDEHGKRTIMVYVYNQNLDLVKNRIEKLLKDVDIYEIKLEKNEREGKVVAYGEVPPYKRIQYDQVMGAFSEDVLDLVKDAEGETLVQIDMQVTEMSTSISKSLGIEWSTGKQTVSGNTVTTTSGGTFAPTYMEIMPSLEPGVKDYFKIGQFQRSIDSALVTKINALIQEGKARLLSKPKLVVVSGQEASFLVGGEVPVRTTTSSGGGVTQENVSFKSYGISMTVTPTIRKSKISIDLSVEVSDIDAANAVGNDVAFTTRSAQTQLNLDDGETIVLAGLIKSNRNTAVKRVPFVSDIPIIGLLFRSKSTVTPDTDLEMVIALTPHVLGDQENTAVSSSAGTSTEQKLPVSGGNLPDKIPTQYLGIPKEMAQYVSEVQRKISQAIIYPSEAQQYGWEGTVKVGMLILNDGTLVFALVKESSGHEIFDEVALNTAKQLAPFSAFPSDTDLQELNVTIPIVYSLKKN